MKPLSELSTEESTALKFIDRCLEDSSTQIVEYDEFAETVQVIVRHRLTLLKNRYDILHYNPRSTK